MREDWLERLPRRVRHYVEEPLARIALRAKVMEPYWRFRFRAFGRASILDRPDWIYGPQQISIGNGVMIMKGVYLTVEREAWGSPGPALWIGDHVGIRPYCTISAAERVIIEPRTMIGSFSSIIDNDHTPVTGEESILSTPRITGPIRIGEGTWVGERVAILRGSDIGRNCVIGTNSVVRGSIPDHSIAVGAPARVVGSTLDRGRGETAPVELPRRDAAAD